MTLNSARGLDKQPQYEAGVDPLRLLLASSQAPAATLPTTADRVGELFQRTGATNPGIHASLDLVGNWFLIQGVSASAGQTATNATDITAIQAAVATLQTTQTTVIADIAALDVRVTALELDYHIPTGAALPTTATKGDLFLLTAGANAGLHEALDAVGNWLKLN